MDKKVRNNHKDSAGVEDPQGCSGQAGRAANIVRVVADE